MQSGTRYAQQALERIHQSARASRRPLVRRERPGAADITQAIDWALPETVRISDRELDAAEQLLGACLDKLLQGK